METGDRRCAACASVARPRLVVTTRGGRIVHYECQGCKARFAVGGPERPAILLGGALLLAATGAWAGWHAVGGERPDPMFDGLAIVCLVIAVYGVWQFTRERAAAHKNPIIRD